jgi:hypothetical protein
MEIGVVELSERRDHPVGTHAITLKKIRGVDRDGLGFLCTSHFGGYACQNLCFTHTYDLTKAKGTH